MVQAGDALPVYLWFGSKSLGGRVFSDRVIGLFPMPHRNALETLLLEFWGDRTADGRRILGRKFSPNHNMTEPKPNNPAETPATPPGSQEVHSALIARLARLRPVPAQVKPAKSLQPTPEAAQTRTARLRRKQRLLLQKAKRGPGSQLNAIPPAPDPLAP